MKNIIRILFGILPVMTAIPIVEEQEKPIDILLEGLASKNTEVGGYLDENNCCESCGFEYCPGLKNCVRRWETYCQEFDFPYNILYQGSGIILPMNEKNKNINKYIKDG